MKVSGTLTDSYGALDGATIILLRGGKRTNLATTSDQEGKFKIENDEIKLNDEFEIRYVGLKTTIKKAKDLQNAKIFLQEDVQQLDEVVIGNKDENSNDTKFYDWIKGIGKKSYKVEKTKKSIFKSPAFMLSVLGLVTIGTIIIIIKKTR